MLNIRLIGPHDEPFVYELYASTRMEEAALWGWDEKMTYAFLKMQRDAQAQSYRVYYPDLCQHIVLMNGVRAGRRSRNRKGVDRRNPG